MNMTQDIQSQVIADQKLQVIPIPFFANIPANGRITLVSSAVSENFAVKGIEAHFRDDTANNVRVYVYSGNNRNAPNTAPPNDNNIISTFSPTPYLSGEGEIIDLPTNYTPDDGYEYLKVYFENNNAYAITCLVVVTIGIYSETSSTTTEVTPITNEQLAIAGEYKDELIGKAKAAVDVATDVMKGTPALLAVPLANLKNQQVTDQNGLLRRWQELAVITNVIPPSMPLLDRVNSGRDWIERVTKESFDVSTTASIVNMITSAFGGSVWNYEQWLNSLFGLTDKVHEAYSMGIDYALIKPMSYIWNKTYTPEIPQISSLIRMVQRKTITQEQFLEYSSYSGYDTEWANRIYDSERTLLDENTIVRLYQREWITHADAQHFLQTLGYSSEDANKKVNLAIPQIPFDTMLKLVILNKYAHDNIGISATANEMSAQIGELIYEAHFSPPPINVIIRAMRRGFIPKSDTNKWFGLADLDPRYNETLWTSLLDEIPDSGDLINMRVKEIISQDTFNKYMSYYGWNQEWSNNLWNAHFSPATWTDFLTAMRRKMTVNIPHAEGASTMHTFGDDAGKDLQILRELSILVDYDDRYWDFFSTRIYNDPTPRMAQWGYESHVINETQLRDTVHKFGFTPDTEIWYADMLMHFRDRAWINRYLTQALTNYVNGTMDYAELETIVKTETNSTVIAQYMQKIGDLRKRKSAIVSDNGTETLISLGEEKQMFFRGIINDDTFKQHLMSRGYTTLDIENMVALIRQQKDELLSGGSKEGLTIAELFDAWRYEQLTETELLSNLIQRGMTQYDAQLLINTKKVKWNMNQTTD